MTFGKCRKDKKKCDGSSLVCRFRPRDKHPTYQADMGGGKRNFYNFLCSNFVKDKCELFKVNTSQIESSS